ncbi:melanoma antigen preferentially expressed in tumors-like [Phocoena sinus]|uniref:Melanoma antigen preferentially expressed in tumors-like n=1 Tax=Phocoena sinus TaxID=42100 RepID=A0A8C9C3L7_PHOSS|nr:melanoma antigen preferentially expressed in tumors-like [Phocoena sinus]
MSAWNPLRLLGLAGMSLLRDETSVISILEYLPTELFPPLFILAFCGRHSEALKAMVQAWPFVRLPLGGLMQTPHRGTLQAVLDGIDVLVAQQDRPRRCKLRVLDLRHTGQDFWRKWCGDGAHGYSSTLMAPVAEDRSRTEQSLTPVVVFIELHLKERTMDRFLTYLIRWVEQRKASVHLCCKKLKILSMSMENIMKVLSRVQLDCIQEVQVNCTWHLSTLAVFAPLLGQMGNVQRLLLSHIHVSALDEQEQQHVVQITSQFLRLHHLRDLCMESPSFLEGCLDEMLRCLTTPLDNLAITHCLLSDSDLSHLSQCPNISQLKGLDLSGITLTYSSPELLPVLLEKVAATLQELYLEQCGIMDSHLETILQPLSRCSQLMFFSLRGNLISMAVMEKLLRHTSGLPSLSQELYPVPQESYSSQRILQPGRLAQCRAELFEILRVLGRPRIIWISSSPCLHCGDNTFSHPQPIVYR